MYSKEDFTFESFDEVFDIILMAPFIGLVAPFLLVAYKMGFVQDITGWLDS